MSPLVDSILHGTFVVCVAVYIIVVVKQSRDNKKLCRENDDLRRRMDVEVDCHYKVECNLADKIHRLRSKISYLTEQLNQRNN